MNLKALIEKRNALIADMKSLCDKATAETRAMTTEEQTDYDAKKAEVEALNKTIRSIEEQNTLNLNSAKSDGTATDKEQAETRAFENYLRTGQIVETREDVNLTKGDNGAVIPATIANKIIRKVIDICPIYQMATRYTLAGTLSIPYYDEGTQAISMAYATEFTDLASTSGKFLSIELKGYLAGALSKVSRSLINNSQFDIVSYVINEVSVSAAKWGYTLFGKPVYTTDSVSAIASEKTAIYYGDMSGLAVKTSEDVSIQILNEKYATQHAVGVIAWVEIDAKVENAQKIAALKMKKAGG